MDVADNPACYEDIVTEFDTNQAEIPGDPMNWSPHNVLVCMQWIVERFHLWHVDVSPFCCYDGRHIISKGRDFLMNINECFGVILWELFVHQMEKFKDTKSPHVIQIHKRRYTSKLYIWQFVLEVLVDDNHQNVISWFSSQRGNFCFKIHDPKKLAALWGVHTNNPTMTYDKFSRSLRLYYRTNPPLLCKPYSFGEYAYQRIYQFINIESQIHRCPPDSTDEKWLLQFKQKIRMMRPGWERFNLMQAYDVQTSS